MIIQILIALLSILLIITIAIIIYMKFIAEPEDCPVCLKCAQKCLSSCDGSGSTACKSCLLTECS